MVDEDDVDGSLGEDFEFLNGNEAVARGALEADVDVAAGYPGTPSTEALEALEEIKNDDMYLEWSSNEKTGLEVAGGASWVNQRGLATMKMSGLNVASDSFISFNYSGVNGGLVLYVADDPETHAGMAEQDTRYYAKMGPAPLLDPSNPNEAKKFVKLAFDLSEETQAPVIVRSTTNIAHASSKVELGEIRDIDREASLDKDMHRYTKIAGKAQHEETIKRLNDFKEAVKDYDLNPMEINSELGIIGTSIGWEFLKELTDLSNYSWLKIDVPVPAPTEKIEKMVKKCDKILIIEELEPIVETEVKSIANEIGETTEIIGKRNGPMPEVGEYNDEIIKKGLKKLTDTEIETESNLESVDLDMDSPPRPLTFCAGCPHRGTFFNLNKAIENAGYSTDEIITTGDIGCTIIGTEEPFETVWTEISMGASIGAALGFEQGGIEKPIIATIGDSTFFHAGLPPLVNAVHQNYNINIIVMDNRVTAMTGQQDSPSTDTNLLGKKSKVIKPEKIAEAVGVDFVEVLNPYKKEKSQKTIEEALNHKGVSFIVMRAPCALWKPREEYLTIDREACISCDICLNETGCPALHKVDGKMQIRQDICIGSACNLCKELCPVDAIKDPFLEEKE